MHLLTAVESNETTDDDGETFNFGSSLDADSSGSPLNADGDFTLDTDDESPSRYKAPEPPSIPPRRGRCFREKSTTDATDSDSDESILFAEADDRERLYDFEKEENYSWFIVVHI